MKTAENDTTQNGRVVVDARTPTAGRTDLTVGVVIPCHNYGRFLGEAVTSVLDQTRPADAILVVDDGSVDDTASIAGRFGERIRYLRIDNSGPSAARNVGARALDTDLVVFLDADDRLDTSYIDRCVAALPQDWSSYFVYSHFQRFGGADTIAAAPPYDRSRLARENFIHPASLLPRAQVARIGYDENLRTGLEDWDLYLTLAEAGIEGVLVDEPLLLYRLHGDGVTWRLRRKPIRLATLRIRLLVKHRALYRATDATRQIWSILRLLVTDTLERYQVGRRLGRMFELGSKAVRRETANE